MASTLTFIVLVDTTHWCDRNFLLCYVIPVRFSKTNAPVYRKPMRRYGMPLDIGGFWYFITKNSLPASIVSAPSFAAFRREGFRVLIRPVLPIFFPTTACNLMNFHHLETMYDFARICPYINNEWGSTLDCFNIIVCLCMGGQIFLRYLRWLWAGFAHHIQTYCFSPVKHIKITWEKIALHFATVQLTPAKLSSFVCRDSIGVWKRQCEI